MKFRSPFTVLATAALAALAMATPASAATPNPGTITANNTTLIFTAGNGVDNDLSVGKILVSGQERIALSDQGALLTENLAHCVTTNNGHLVHCDLALVSSLKVELGGGADRMRGGVELSIPMIVDGGTGDDDISTGNGDDTIDSGSGNDTVLPNGGHDTVRLGLNADTADVRDGQADDVDCGARGLFEKPDEVRADAGDRMNRCEKVIVG
ncbi:hypothetical protein [Nonomuraea sediminis]|uniref:hypothetical protein n=1 Tax=Nonomuraea sediminis TaxID=2835864 RepID=UPI001BDCC943|nr:hypothetical protein [Nonomuraea sediminis]